VPETVLPPAPGGDYDEDLDSPLKYVRLAAEVRGWLTSGRYRPGDRVPSIDALSAERGWSRPTCARALQALEAEGLLRRYPGAGYVVTRTAGDQPQGTLAGFGPPSAAPGDAISRQSPKARQRKRSPGVPGE
jgi:DNA-binding GntR family transcriptional regulator